MAVINIHFASTTPHAKCNNTHSELLAVGISSTANQLTQTDKETAIKIVVQSPSHNEATT